MCKLAWKFGKNIVNLQLETNELGIMVETNNRRLPVGIQFLPNIAASSTGVSYR